MITCELKDKILSDLVSIDGVMLAIDTREKGNDYAIDRFTYVSILEHFERKGFIIPDTITIDGGWLIKVTPEAHEFWQRGGFLVQEEILKGNIEKLGLEIDLLSKELSPDLLDKAKKLSSIGNNILSVLKMINVI